MKRIWICIFIFWMMVPSTANRFGLPSPHLPAESEPDSDRENTEEKSDDPATGMAIRKMTLMKKKLQLHIGGFTTQAKGEKCTGRIRIGLVLRTRSDRILYRKSDTLTPHQDHIKITVNLFWLKKGSYKITVKVRDLLSGRSTHRTIEPVVE